MTDELEQVSGAEEELDPIAHARQDEQVAARELVMLELYTLRRKMLQDPALVRVSLGATASGDYALTGAELTIRGDQRDPYNGVAIFNPTSATIAVGFQAGGAYLAPAIVPPYSFLTLPERFTNLSVGLPLTADQQQSYTNPLSVLRLRYPPEPSAGAYGEAPGGSGGSPIETAANPGSQVTIGTAGTASVIAANASRHELFVVNVSSGWVTLGLSAAIPAMWSGIPLAPDGGAWSDTVWAGPVSMIAAANGSLVSIAEI